MNTVVTALDEQNTLRYNSRGTNYVDCVTTDKADYFLLLVYGDVESATGKFLDWGLTGCKSFNKASSHLE